MTNMIYALVGPHAAGKATLVTQLISMGIPFIPTYTTYEFPQHGRTRQKTKSAQLYRTVSREEFSQLDLVVQFTHKGDFYGIRKDDILNALKEHAISVMILESSGIKQLNKLIKKKLSTIYLMADYVTLIDRMLVLLLPLIGVALPLFRILPGLYRWRMESRVYRWYGELKLLEHHLEEEALPLAPALGAELLERLSRIETEASRRKLPLAFSKDMYTLREHIQLVRRRITSALEPNPSK